MTTDTETRPTTSGQGGDNPPVAGPPTTSTSSTPTVPPGIAKAVLKLTVGEGAAGKCKAVEVADLRRMQTASKAR